ncbi:MAG: hypothetical protein ACNA8N_09930 [Trueperaceae bacterium]
MPLLADPPARLHLSVDDVVTVLRDLAERPLATPWAQPTLGWLRELHEASGAVVSLYPFLRDGGWRLERMPARHRDAFEAASGWLRFGFHALDAASDYGIGGLPAAVAGAHYGRFVTAVRRFAGAAAIDRAPRVHRFLGTARAVRAWRDAPDGVVGLLTADDARADVYHLDGETRARLARDGVAFDARERIWLVASLPRLERLAAVAERLDAAVAAGWTRRGVPLCLFTHEVHLGDPRVRARVGRALAWARSAGAAFAFPQDVWPPAQPDASDSTS